MIGNIVEPIGVENATGLRTTRVQHADVESTETGRCLVNHPSGITLSCEVTDDEQLGPSVLLGLCAALFVTTGDDHACTFFDQHRG